MVYVIEPGWIVAACWGVVCGNGVECCMRGDTGAVAPERYGFMSVSEGELVEGRGQCRTWARGQISIPWVLEA